MAWKTLLSAFHYLSDLISFQSPTHSFPWQPHLSSSHPKDLCSCSSITNILLVVIYSVYSSRQYSNILVKSFLRCCILDETCPDHSFTTRDFFDTPHLFSLTLPCADYFLIYYIIYLFCVFGYCLSLPT